MFLLCFHLIIAKGKTHAAAAFPFLVQGFVAPVVFFGGVIVPNVMPAVIDNAFRYGIVVMSKQIGEVIQSF